MAKGRERLKVTKDIAEKVILLNCEDDTNIRRLEKSLMKLPFIKSEEDLETDRIEQIVYKLERKYDLQLSYLMRFLLEDKGVYSGMLKNRKGDWIITVNGITVRECFLKIAFYIYYYVTNNKEKAT